MFAKKVHKEVGLKILVERRRKDMTQEALAAAAGISRTKLSSIECGTSTFTLDLLIKIATAMEVDYHVLLDND